MGVREAGLIKSDEVSIDENTDVAGDASAVGPGEIF
jgi:hypothetical protein